MSAHHTAGPCGMDHDALDDVTTVHDLTPTQARVARILGWGPRMTPREWRCVVALGALIGSQSDPGGLTGIPGPPNTAQDDSGRNEEAA